ncbi:DUF305 domain-containing protein [Nocardioides sp. CFH 31398]|uniref:DUF305 domain-containing protein n=1 Tax=Nocardioides sp. CFH 31398 TaxID=2919579 RepID=UPI001F054C0F|nr:DUF305 domain-containing protein [Nocardioides sp. CFH 31398]MCH1865599.1 DUF305 domain-containing protein [Nocardioides sp. CFH 31398]
MRTPLAGAALPATALTTALLAGLLAGCGADDSTASEQTLSDTDHNDADVTFAQDMIPHHAQALTLVDLTVGRDLDPGLTRIAEQIRAEQAPEIETMADWLGDWDEEVPETVRDHSNAGHGGGSATDAMREMDDEGHSMEGMLTADQLETLEEAPDDEFASLWVEAMIGHHEGAIAMAETEEAEGMYRPAVELAGDVVDAQTAEIEELEQIGG